ncbi:hypothetical protein Mal15_28100 [Stieleria maiorica]|uniref:Signal peptidase I n=2 Tax=Stieleria maiorica TaxID=2795974 RepID=A0A5B9MGU1_9BACT|nr:hypothetical protein Mal15_28100 [Stieleria maiorica]
MGMHELTLPLAQDDGGGIIGLLILVIQLAILVVVIAGLWKTFEKAGKPGWGAIIPIYNIILLLQIAGRPIWWIVLFFIPLVNLILAIIVSIDVAKNFGKGVGYGIGLAFLGFIFYPMLGFGDAKYQGVAAVAA